jgi:hypothetical protein
VLMKDHNGMEVLQKSWRLICPECEEDVRVSLSSTARFCGICAGDNGRDVAMRREPSELPPTQSA